MNITSGYQLEQPQVLVPWGISEVGFRNCSQDQNCVLPGTDASSLPVYPFVASRISWVFVSIHQLTDRSMNSSYLEMGLALLKPRMRSFRTIWELPSGRRRRRLPGRKKASLRRFGESKTFKSSMRFKSISDQRSLSESPRAKPVPEASVSSATVRRPGGDVRRSSRRSSSFGAADRRLVLRLLCGRS